MGMGLNGIRMMMMIKNILRVSSLCGTMHFNALFHLILTVTQVALQLSCGDSRRPEQPWIARCLGFLEEGRAQVRTRPRVP